MIDESLITDEIHDQIMTIPLLCIKLPFYVALSFLLFHVLPTKQFYNYLSIHLCLDKYLTKIIDAATKRCVKKRLKIPEGVIRKQTIQWSIGKKQMNNDLQKQRSSNTNPTKNRKGM